MTKTAAYKAETYRLYGSYFTGFVISFMLTLAAFAAVTLQVDSQGDAYPKTALIIGLLVLAAIQLVAQLVFFFHLGREPKPRLNTVSFLFMLMVVGIIGIGSLWIMYNLDYNMTGREVEVHIQRDENIYRDVTPDDHQH